MARRRYIRPGQEAPVWTNSGRWGPKRVQVTQCWATLKAEDVYTGPLRDDAARARPGARGTLEWRLSGRPVEQQVEWELRPNTVWRHGRLFFRCPRCARLATRLDVPTEDAGAACRRCFGLTYESRREDYKSAPSFLPCYSLGQMARVLTWSARERRAAASAERYPERREILEQFAAAPQGPKLRP
jgi:hypothetical protein